MAAVSETTQRKSTGQQRQGDGRHEPSVGSNPISGRDTHGRFAAGNPGGPGNPNMKRHLEMRDAFMAAITIDDIKALARKLYDMAMGGNLKAAKLLLDYLLGKPILVTTTAEAMKKLEAERSLGDDPMCGLKRLRDRNPDK